ncbi:MULTISPECIES: serine/threonine-protein kinase [unclassified Crossiella]|uniref:serine/threonine-protein kinase n=1 Tax=unclassified Crossiella TaxID=2620835 RepID=UPI0020001A65|nr:MULTISPECIES: serine/threonine-protein kinase [unclassified Crossiella]MCK2243400.1 serine/threonine protein kinase [Crossiella sp. S99.2]MCK2254131.1 serine/threonine protein kinase [Crossiella sp. S99.1]
MNYLLADRYRLDGELARGGMSVVWYGFDTVLEREVAIKELRTPPDWSAATAAAHHERIRREATSAARLDHPNVVRVHDLVSADGRPWIVMEQIPSRSLQQVVDEDGALPPMLVARIGLAVVEALDNAHHRGILHRDVKPANILIADDGQIFLTDFGVARLTEAETAATTGALHGSPGYIAPERLKGQLPRPASDFWSLGATLYTAVEGKAPYARESAAATLTATITAEPPTTSRAGVLGPVVSALLRRNPVDRPGPDQLREQLGRIMAGRAGSPPPRKPTTAPPPRRTRLLFAGMTMLALSVAILVYLSLTP